MNRIYLVFSSLKNQRRFAQTKVHYKFFNLPEKKTTHKLSKVTTLKNVFSSLHVIVKLACKTCFHKFLIYYMQKLEDIVSYKNLLLPWGSFQLPCFLFVLFFISRITVQCFYQSSKMNLSYYSMKHSYT